MLCKSAKKKSKMKSQKTDFDPNELIQLNIGGVRFTTTRDTINRFPYTRLQRISTNDSNYNIDKLEFFYDRNPKLFGHILDFYRTGELHFSHCLCGPLIKKELIFWEISEEYISPCCWKAFNGFEQVNNVIESYFQQFQ